jgi:hypothetical protein
MQHHNRALLSALEQDRLRKAAQRRLHRERDFNTPEPGRRMTLLWRRRALTPRHSRAD